MDQKKIAMIPAAIAAATSLFTLLTLCCSYLHLFGYWRVFGLDFLAFIGLTDLVRYSLYPMLFAAIYGAAAGFVQRARKSGSDLRRPNMDSADTSEPRSYFNWVVISAVALAFTVGIVHSTYRWYGWSPHVAALLSLSAAGAISLTASRLEANGSLPVWASYIVYVAAAALAYSYLSGEIRAQVQERAPPVAMTAEDAFGSVGSDEIYVFLGHLGDHVILKEWGSRNLIIQRADKLASYRLVFVEYEGVDHASLFSSEYWLQRAPKPRLIPFATRVPSAAGDWKVVH